MKKLSNQNLIENAERILLEICAGKTTFSVPPQDTDTDMVIDELIKRFKKQEKYLNILREKAEVKIKSK